MRRLLAPLAIALAPGLALAQSPSWSPSNLGAIPGLIDLRASPHTESGLVALTEEGGWRALALADGRLVDAGEAPFMGRLAPPEIIPDGRVGVAPGPPPAEDDPAAARAPSAAWYEGPTRRYAHGALGDAVEAEILQTAFADRRILAHRLGGDAVFEDLEPRIVDADGDGAHEVLAIKAYLDRGAAIALYAPNADGDGLAEIAAGPPIGRANRWMNPAGVADFDGDGRPEIAVVDRPHIKGDLVVYRWDGESRTIEEVARHPGFSNHANGSVALGLSALVDLDGDGRPELLLPRRDRRALSALSLAADGGLTERLRVFNAAAPIGSSIVPVDLEKDGATEIVWGLENGAIRVLRQTD
ncbi:MAG: VCBS repeat-containing protein [Marivibrio sp.]|uniref:FG-GAP repeat domain-containing protein n=1 Tax=Marivibrio sp. TaxID=2039719 RepID=UPI0032EAEE25